MSTAVNGTVTVKAGDSLSKIAAAEYTDLVYEMNSEVIGDDPSQIQPGQVLILPGLDESYRLYIRVDEGDTLTGIVAAWLWLPVYVANHEIVGVNPDVIHPGMTLEIPELV